MSDQRHLEVLVAVREMRALQREWFAGKRTPEQLAAAKKAERRVDMLLRELDAPAPSQASLFGAR
jgi:hypothetical protein